MPPQQIRFESEEAERPPTSTRPLSTMTGFVIRLSLAKDETTAQYILLGGAIAAIIAAGMLPYLLTPGGYTLPHTGDTSTVPISQ